MVVEFTFFLVGQELALLRGVHLGWFVMAIDMPSCPL